MKLAVGKCHPVTQNFQLAFQSLSLNYEKTTKDYHTFEKNCTHKRKIPKCANIKNKLEKTENMQGEEKKFKKNLYSQKGKRRCYNCEKRRKHDKRNI